MNVDKFANLFPLISRKDAISLVESLISSENSNLVLISLILGVLEHHLTRPACKDIESSYCDVDFKVLKSLHDDYFEYLKKPVLIEKTFNDEVLAAEERTKDDRNKLGDESGRESKREKIKEIYNKVWFKLARSYRKDKHHMQTIYSLLADQKLDNFGVTISVVASCHLLNHRDVTLVMSEDHSWIEFEKDSNNNEDFYVNNCRSNTTTTNNNNRCQGYQSMEVTWHGKQTKDKRGTTVTNIERRWLTSGGHAIRCNSTESIAVAMVTKMNPFVDGSEDSMELISLKYDLLCMLHRRGCLNRFPQALVELYKLKNQNFTSINNKFTTTRGYHNNDNHTFNHNNRNDNGDGSDDDDDGKINPLKYLNKAITINESLYNQSYVYPYLEMAKYYYRYYGDGCHGDGCNFGEMVMKWWRMAADVVSKYVYNKEDEELYKTFYEIANNLMPELIIRSSTGTTIGHNKSGAGGDDDDEDEDGLKNATDCDGAVKKNHQLTTKLNHNCVNNTKSETATCKSETEIENWKNPRLFSDFLLFYDGLCCWEECSSVPVLHETWAKRMCTSLMRFHFSARDKSRVLIVAGDSCYGDGGGHLVGEKSYFNGDCSGENLRINVGTVSDDGCCRGYNNGGDRGASDSYDGKVKKAELNNNDDVATVKLEVVVNKKRKINGVDVKMENETKQFKGKFVEELKYVEFTPMKINSSSGNNSSSSSGNISSTSSNNNNNNNKPLKSKHYGPKNATMMTTMPVKLAEKPHQPTIDLSRIESVCSTSDDENCSRLSNLWGKPTLNKTISGKPGYDNNNNNNNNNNDSIKKSNNSVAEKPTFIKTSEQYMKQMKERFGNSECPTRKKKLVEMLRLKCSESLFNPDFFTCGRGEPFLVEDSNYPKNHQNANLLCSNNNNNNISIDVSGSSSSSAGSSINSTDAIYCTITNPVIISNASTSTFTSSISTFTSSTTTNFESKLSDTNLNSNSNSTSSTVVVTNRCTKNSRANLNHSNTVTTTSTNAADVVGVNFPAASLPITANTDKLNDSCPITADTNKLDNSCPITANSNKLNNSCPITANTNKLTANRCVTLVSSISTPTTATIMDTSMATINVPITSTTTTTSSTTKPKRLTKRLNPVTFTKLSTEITKSTMSGIESSTVLLNGTTSNFYGNGNGRSSKRLKLSASNNVKNEFSRNQTSNLGSIITTGKGSTTSNYSSGSTINTNTTFDVITNTTITSTMDATKQTEPNFVTPVIPAVTTTAPVVTMNITTTAPATVTRAANTAKLAAFEQLKVVLKSNKMQSIIELVQSEKLNTQAIKLLLTAQSSVKANNSDNGDRMRDRDWSPNLNASDSIGHSVCQSTNRNLRKRICQ